MIPTHSAGPATAQSSGFDRTFDSATRQLWGMERSDDDLRRRFEVTVRDRGLRPRLVDLVTRLASSEVGDDLVARLPGASGPATPLADADLDPAHAAHLWHLDRAADGGIELTGAGNLRPDDVFAASAAVPSMAEADVRWLSPLPLDTLANLGDARAGRAQISPTAAALARSALREPPV